MKPPKAADHVKNWLFRSPDQCFCDECIARSLGEDIGKVHDATRRLGGRWGSSRYTGRCDICKGVKPVTIVNGNVPV